MGSVLAILTLGSSPLFCRTSRHSNFGIGLHDRNPSGSLQHCLEHGRKISHTILNHRGSRMACGQIHVRRSNSNLHGRKSSCFLFVQRCLRYGKKTSITSFNHWSTRPVICRIGSKTSRMSFPFRTRLSQSTIYPTLCEDHLKDTD